MPQSRYDLEILIRTRQQGNGFRQAQQQTQSFANVAKRVLGVAGVAGAATLATRAVTRFVAESNTEFRDFQNSAKEVFTLLPDLSAQAKTKMSADILDYSKDVGRVTDETVPALYQAISAGVPERNVFDFMQVASDAALGGVTELETAVDGISTVTNAYGREVISAQQASDLLFTAVKGGKTDFRQLSRFMYQVVPTASALNVEFGNVTAAMASITAQGTPTRVAATQIRQLLIELSKEGSGAANTFERIAGKSFRQFIAEGGNLQEALQLMEQEAQRTDVGVNDLFQSVQAGNAALQLTGKGTDKFTEQLKAAENATGATKEAAAEMSTSMEHLEGRVDAATEAFKIQRGEALAPVKRSYLENKLAALQYATAIIALREAQKEGTIGYFEAIKLAAELNFTNKEAAEVLEEVRIANLTSAEAQQAVIEKKHGGAAAAAANRTSIEAETAAIVKQKKALADLEDQQEDVVDQTADQGRTNRQAIRVQEAQAKAAEETAERMAELNEQQEVQNQLIEQQRQAQINLFESTSGPVQDLLQAQQDLQDAQGTWVETTRDRSEEIAQINQQLAGQLSEEQEDAYNDILDTVDEGSAQWLDAYNALQDNITQSQRRALIAQRADLQSAHGEVISVYTGDARGAEEAQKRIEEANEAIAQSYRKRAFEQTLAQTGVTEETLQLGVELGVLTQQEADLRLEQTRRLEAINKLTQSQEFLGASATVQAEAVRLLAEGEAETAEKAFEAAKEVGGLRDNLDEMAGYYEAEVNVDTGDAIQRLERIRDLLNEVGPNVAQAAAAEQAAAYEAAGQTPPGGQHGGIITGPPGIDNVLARLTPGEGILPVNAMRQIGARQFEQLRQGNVSGLGGDYYDQRQIVQHFQSREAAALGLGLVQIERRKRLDRLMGVGG